MEWLAKLFGANSIADIMVSEFEDFIQNFDMIIFKF